jgi:sulfate permease, SulP family
MSKASSGAVAWPIFRGFAGWRRADLGPDLIAGLTLAAIAIPEQMATARLGGFPPAVGFLALVAGAIGFAVFGGSRTLSAGADSTITPIFAGALAAITTVGAPHYEALAAMLALMVGAIVAAGGLFRLGWIADLLSIPVTTGFLAGIAGHIVLSQAPAVLGLPSPEGPLLDRLTALAGGLGATNPLTLAIGLGVLAVMMIGEQISARIPAALIGLAVATGLAAAFNLEGRGVATIGAVAAATPTVKTPDVAFEDVLKIAQLAALVAIVVMVQTAATTRSFVSDPDRGPDVDRDFIGVGAASVIAGLVGVFPLDASPPRTAVVVETGGRSQLASLVAAAIVLTLALFGAGLLAHIPIAALAGVLLYVAQRIVRFSTIAAIWRQSRAEFALLIVTMAAILIVPIQQGVGFGIVLSLLHGIWTTTRGRPVEFVRIPGTSIWWPRGRAQQGEGRAQQGERVKGVLVAGFQAPLSFLNANELHQTLQELVSARTDTLKLLIIEAANVAEIDYTAAQVLAAAIRRFRSEGLDVAIARLESTRAEEACARFGIIDLLGADHLFHSVEQAVDALAPASQSPSRSPPRRDESPRPEP